MQLVSPPMPGSLASARVQLQNAQGFAANLSNAPGVDTAANITGGIQAAKRAAAELFLAEPRSPFQDLVAARRHVIEGQQLLEQAYMVHHGDGPIDTTPQVRALAGEAFDAFEQAFEIIDND